MNEIWGKVIANKEEYLAALFVAEDIRHRNETGELDEEAKRLINPSTGMNSLEEYCLSHITILSYLFGITMAEAQGLVESGYQMGINHYHDELDKVRNKLEQTYKKADL